MDAHLAKRLKKKDSMDNPPWMKKLKNKDEVYIPNMDQEDIGRMPIVPDQSEQIFDPNLPDLNNSEEPRLKNTI